MEQKDIDYIIEAHRDHPRKESKSYRKWDAKTPYHVHPLLCASMIATETSLAEGVRRDGAQVLLYHDVLEDTTRPLPDWLSSKVRQMVDEMTFRGGSYEEMQVLWSRPPEIRLYKLYDKVSNLLDGCWMDGEKREGYEAYTRRLSGDVEWNYGVLNITRLARALTGQ